MPSAYIVGGSGQIGIATNIVGFPLSLMGATKHLDRQLLLPQLAAYPCNHFDYVVDSEACKINSNTA